MLLAQLRAAYQEAMNVPSPDDRFQRPDGSYFEVELRKGSKVETLDRSKAKIITGATRIDLSTENIVTTLFVPDNSISILENILIDYRSGPLSAKDRPPNKAYVDPIETIRRARLFSFWTDTPAALPDDAHAQIWWEVWCVRGTENAIIDVITRMECRVSDEGYWLHFPEVVVLPVFARRAEIEVALFACRGISELRRGSDSPTFFTEDERENQNDWAANLATRTIWPGQDVPRVCLLDTGVNRAHVLLEPALFEGDLLTANPDWVPTDNRVGAHGTKMAGLAAHGDLFAALQDDGERPLSHRLESVRIMPADGFPPNEPARLSSITSSAVALAEIANPDFERVFCMAITNEDVSGDRATAWSASIDRAAAGHMEGEENGPKRLFFISAGNIPAVMNAADLGPVENYPIEDPAQAWNALTVGGYTEKQLINDEGLEGHHPMAAVGEVSPYSRNSLDWRQGKSPVKPEIVMEAGNRARSSNGRDLISCPSLELLTTGSSVDRLPIVNFAATSASTALAARFAARLKAEHPGYWPETIRALMVHSAEWTEPMRRRLDRANGVRERQRLARSFGYGVPSFPAATASARNHLAIVAQQTIWPYRRKNGNISFNECHYYSLPWPKAILEQYGDSNFVLKVTLSYFVEPNPGRSAAIDPQKYQSFGLRFDLKRAQETEAQFKHWINAEEATPAGVIAGKRPDDSGWVFGPTSISAGSIHCDIWKGNGAQLAVRNMICVKPVSGWWKERRSPNIHGQSARYSLVVTLISPQVVLDLYTPIQNELMPIVSIELPI